MRKVLLAVSGGADSMYMACRADELFPDAETALAHCNFRLRGDESDADEEFVRKWAEKHGKECHVRAFDTEKYARERGISIEMAARELRYNWFEELADTYGYDSIATAHNADDNAETLILNLLRGTGIKGICGMGEHGRIVRPLLGVSRTEIRDWMREHGYSWREDRSNADSRYKRNLVRNEVFPLFERINPSFLRTLNADMRRFRQVEDIAEDYVESVKGQVLDGEGRLRIDALMESRHAEFVLWRLLDGSGIGAEEFESLVGALRSGRQIAGRRFGPVLGVPGGRLMILSEDAAGTTADSPDAGIADVGSDSEPAFGISDRSGNNWSDGLEISYLQRSKVGQLRVPAGTVLMDADKVPLPLHIRPWREGDWMRPLGMRGKKKLSDIFTDMRLSLVEKRAVRVVELEGSHVAAILCSKIDEAVKVGEGTERIVRVREKA